MLLAGLGLCARTKACLGTCEMWAIAFSTTSLPYQDCRLSGKTQNNCVSYNYLFCRRYGLCKHSVHLFLYTSHFPKQYTLPALLLISCLWATAGYRTVKGTPKLRFHQRNWLHNSFSLLVHLHYRYWLCEQTGTQRHCNKMCLFGNKLFHVQ